MVALLLFLLRLLVSPFRPISRLVGGWLRPNSASRWREHYRADHQRHYRRAGTPIDYQLVRGGGR
jgi:hypothetical protein